MKFYAYSFIKRIKADDALDLQKKREELDRQYQQYKQEEEAALGKQDRGPDFDKLMELSSKEESAKMNALYAQDRRDKKSVKQWQQLAAEITKELHALRVKMGLGALNS